MAKHSKTILYVMAVPDANVHELAGDSFPTNGPRRLVGKVWSDDADTFICSAEGQLIPYHPEYIKHLKDKSLLPGNIETAILAGVEWVQI